MPHEQPAAEDSPTQGMPTQGTAVPAPPTDPYEPTEESDDWLDESEELPRRPRRRLLSPVPLALLGVLLAACGFIGGVLVEKGETSSSSSTGAASSLASRFAALRGGASGASGAGGFAGVAGATAGSVAYISDHLRRQHREGDDIAGHNRHEDRQIGCEGDPSR
jgi:hypothetical protein